MTRLRLTLLGIVALLGFALLTIDGSAPVERDSPRTVPWVLPDHRQGVARWRVADDGRIHAHIEHIFLHDITPEMIAWFYQQLPISTVRLGSSIIPLYHVFHHYEHGSLRVVQPSPGGEAGMATGAVIDRREWFGPYPSGGRARILAISPREMIAQPELLGIPMGIVHHRFNAEAGGTRYTVDAIIGSDLPVVGPLINYYLKRWVFHAAMIREWQRHQIQEVSSLQFFLPTIYAQRETAGPFNLSGLETQD